MLKRARKPKVLPDNWEHAADNSKRCYDVAVEAMRERLEKFHCERIGPHRLFLGDCKEILPLIGKFDAIVTDPPYGQNLNVNVLKRGGKRTSSIMQKSGRVLVNTAVLHNSIIGDSEPFNPSHISSAAAEVLIWGAHKFADRLPCGSWLVWDKVPTGKLRSQGDGEAAWINREQPLRIFRLLWDGLCVGSGARHEVTAGQQRLHPAQKPEVLMSWCLSFVKGKTVCDPYMGAGSTGVAAVKAGKIFVGIEIDKKYFGIACRRISEGSKQPDLFIKTPKKKTKEQHADLFGAAHA